MGESLLLIGRLLIIWRGGEREVADEGEEVAEEVPQNPQILQGY